MTAPLHTPPVHTADQAKALAKALRADQAAAGHAMSHSAALERVARDQGYGTWNAMSARLSNAPEIALQVGDRVAGRYLGQAFAASVLAVRSLGQGQGLEITLEFDAPVDVVTFDSFSAFRSRVTATISPGGTSFARTGNGVPQLVVTRVDG
ncbi:glyoxalase superfamily protein [Thalassobaculum sp. OXR-137]|uniref:glyoxalase superfamily protein n=1 Tax=Thalassobaculum sp. OXR-137 TaxID=3100173 RepID=UPI002AC9E4BB|nr:glyoxalase superfamily protein [Thalassobaculum sp. OXR-137]WPZ33114.1 glyoxalase superfamily protein [Thalassobaculum sp. OXR-137]